VVVYEFDKEPGSTSGQEEIHWEVFSSLNLVGLHVAMHMLVVSSTSGDDSGHLSIHSCVLLK
jgi:hypothetical protein